MCEGYRQAALPAVRLCITTGLPTSKLPCLSCFTEAGKLGDDKSLSKMLFDRRLPPDAIVSLSEAELARCCR